MTEVVTMLVKRIIALTREALSFDSGDYIAVDSEAAGSRKMSKDTLLKETAQNALAGNVAPEFDEDGETDYSAGVPVARDGKIFVFKVDHSGVWSDVDVEEVDAKKIFLLKKDFNDSYVLKDGCIAEKLNGYYSSPNSSGVSTFTASDQFVSVKLKVDKLSTYKFYCEKGYTSNNPRLIFVDGEGKFFLEPNLVSSVVDNAFSVVNNSASFVIVQMKIDQDKTTLFKFGKVEDFSFRLVNVPLNLVSNLSVGDWHIVDGSVVENNDRRYVRCKVSLSPFKTYSFKCFLAGSSTRICLCNQNETGVVKSWSYGISGTEVEVSTQAYPMDLYISTRIFQGTDFSAINSISVVEKSTQDGFKPLCDWTNDASNMSAGWYNNNLVLQDGDNDIAHSWECIFFSHSAPIPVTPGQWEFKGQGVLVSNMIVMKSDAQGTPSRDFYVTGLGLGNSTPFTKVFNIPVGVDYVIVQGVCCNGKANSNFYLRRLSESLESGSVFNPVTYGSVVVHTKDARTVADGVGIVDDNGSTDEDRYIVMYPTKQVAGKRKLVVFFHGAGEPVNESSWLGLEKSMPNFFAAMGYVVCACNGMPRAFATANNLPYQRPVGNYMWIESACKMVEKVCGEYDCDPNEIYVYGESQGGMGALNFIEGGNIPVKACVLDSPAISMLYSQLNISAAAVSLKFFYDFENAQEYTPEKVYGLDPFTRNCDKVEIKEDYTLTGGRYLDAAEMAKCVSKRVTKCPVKFFLGTADTTTPAYPSQLVYKQLKNAGQLVACNVYQGIGHCVDQNAPVIGTFSYRDVTYNVTQPIVDMANWWARFGGYDVLPVITPTNS